ncbi:uncharacterized protein LOC116769324 [Danaus plexippus]|uniref:uncharacterized protein LOC116769324 n=1 Tax=Danaus plexippus TaxID=13037 RepID=UPI002AB2671C|nr:uncharacterized protein LOC116769324 [Danaus plexippus]
MEDEIEDLVGDVRYTDSQKSVTTSNVYSFDFTDSSPDGNNSTSKATYVIDCEDSDVSEAMFQTQENLTPHKVTDTCFIVNRNSPDNIIYAKDQSMCTNSSKISILAQETYTQTSKTIIELVHGNPHKIECSTLETQTSFVSITENRTLEYRIHLVNANGTDERDVVNNLNDTNIESHPILANSLEDKSSIYKESETENDVTRQSSNDTIIRFIDQDSKEDLSESKNETPYDSTSVYHSSFDSDMEEDSLMENNYHKKCNKDDTFDEGEFEFVDHDVKELYNKISESPLLLLQTHSPEHCNRNFSPLTPLTEETSHRKDNIVDVTPSEKTLTGNEDSNDTIFVNSCGIRVKMLNDKNGGSAADDILKLPPIQKSPRCPNSTHFNFLFSLNTPQMTTKREEPIPNLYKSQNYKIEDRWEMTRRDLASGESAFISGNSDPPKPINNSNQLPPIHLEGVFPSFENRMDLATKFEEFSKDYDAISIKGKIGELKMFSNDIRQRSGNRSISPTSTSSPGDSKLSDVAEKGCDALCSELLKRLRSSSWHEVIETLENLPKALDSFWCVITENRIATLIRQVIVHIESPRTQVAKAACSSLADILRNTNYTKKPDFYEAIAILLIKTGSFSRPVRRAANVALDDIVCSVDITQSVTAICVYGVGHKSPFVRCASARLLVVCCAMAGGGRRVLRERPPTAAAARRHALRALAELLYDKNTDTRKYAERLYLMLRPLPNFEAYFLTDVDVELASQHMKKFDRLLNKQPR